jgi:hypothetical protein
VLDDFERVDAWSAHPSEGVELRISQGEGFTGKGMRLDFDFHGMGGYAIARRALPLDLPADYEIGFRIRADAPVNDLELKLIDGSGENVWWHNRRRFDYPEQWTRLRTRKRHVEFAWGPKGGGDLDRLAQLELVVTAGTGGKGTVWIDELTFRRREPPPAQVPAPVASAPQVVDGNFATAWRSGSARSLSLDFQRERELGGLVIHWDADSRAAAYAVDLSNDGEAWETVHAVENARGASDPVYLPESEARHLRLRLLRGDGASGDGVGIREIEVKPVEWSATPNAYFASLAKEAPRGRYPRYLTGEQSYWTVVGVNGDTREATINTDGMVETGLGGPSIEPFLHLDGRLLTWADVEATPSLAQGYLPIPSVEWKASSVGMTVTAFAAGAPEASTVYARYRVENRGHEPKTITLYLALRPFQVNPPWQFLNVVGGVAKVKEVELRDGAVLVNGERRVVPVTEPAAFGAVSSGQARLVESLAQGWVPDAKRAVDARGFASAVLAYPLVLPARGAGEVVVAIPLHPGSPVGEVKALEKETTRRWEEELNRFTLRLPPSGDRIVRTLKSQLAYILINRDGPSIQPGSRAYDRSWIRDGSLTSEALLRLGHPREVRSFVEWYAPHQRANGYVPCCVGPRGADPVPEHDSHGQLVYLIAEDFLHTGDRAFLERMWPHVERAVAFIDTLRRQRMTAEYQAEEKRAFYGLVPESISHEGYSAKPMHSYWDDFFALTGLDAAVVIAGALDRKEEGARFAAIRDEFRRDLLASLERAMAKHRIDYLPGSVELGDFDATSTTVGLSPLGGLEYLPRQAVEATFERYYQQSIRARREGAEWEGYTPYEWRTVGTFLRLGWKGRAHEAIDLFFRHQRPPEWNHWAEVVFRDPKTPRFIGDMPHTWVGSDFIRSVLDLFAYERASDGALVVGAGIPEEWVREEPGVEIRGLRTRHGPLSLSMKAEGHSVRVRIEAGMAVPPGGIVVRSPFGRAAKVASPSEITVRALPAEAVLEH